MSSDIELLKEIASKLDYLREKGQHETKEYEQLQEDWENIAHSAMIEKVLNDDNLCL